MRVLQLKENPQHIGPTLQVVLQISSPIRKSFNIQSEG